MTVVNIETGEAVVLDREEAELRSRLIGSALEAAADQFENAMDNLRTAVRERDDIALGYRSPADYISDRFGGRLARLGVDLRREVVREMTEMGMSVRAIAPVLGVGKSTVKRDQEHVSHMGHLHQTPESVERGEALADSGQTSRETSASPTDEEAVAATTETTEGADAGRSANYDPRPPVVGIDGKSYSRPAPKPKPTPTAQSDVDEAVEFVGTIARNLTVLSQMAVPDRRADLAAAWPLALGVVSPAMTDRFTPEQMRSVADGLHDLADEWEARNV